MRKSLSADLLRKGEGTAQQQTLPHPGGGSDLRESGDGSGDQWGSETKCMGGRREERELGLVSQVLVLSGGGDRQVSRGKRTSHCDTCLVRPLSAPGAPGRRQIGFKGLEFRRDLQYDGSYKFGSHQQDDLSQPLRVQKKGLGQNLEKCWYFKKLHKEHIFMVKM